MKKFNQLLILMVIVLLSLAINSCSENKSKPVNRIITLNVDTDNINRRNIDSTCNFGQPKGVSNKDFTIEVKIGDTITWEGISSSTGDNTVDITKIKRQKGKNIFDKDSLIGKGKNRKKVIGKALYSTEVNNKHKDYKYKISFKVNKKGKPYFIDPKIRVVR